MSKNSVNDNSFFPVGQRRIGVASSIEESVTIGDRPGLKPKIGRPGLKPKPLSGNAGGVSANGSTATSRKNSSKQQRRQRPRPPMKHLLRRRKGH